MRVTTQNVAMPRRRQVGYSYSENHLFAVHVALLPSRVEACFESFRTGQLPEIEADEVRLGTPSDLDLVVATEGQARRLASHDNDPTDGSRAYGIYETDNTNEGAPYDRDFESYTFRVTRAGSGMVETDDVLEAYFQPVQREHLRAQRLGYDKPEFAKPELGFEMTSFEVRRGESALLSGRDITVARRDDELLIYDRQLGERPSATLTHYTVTEDGVDEVRQWSTPEWLLAT